MWPFPQPFQHHRRRLKTWAQRACRFGAMKMAGAQRTSSLRLCARCRRRWWACRCATGARMTDVRSVGHQTSQLWPVVPGGGRLCGSETGCGRGLHAVSPAGRGRAGAVVWLPCSAAAFFRRASSALLRAEAWSSSARMVSRRDSRPATAPCKKEPHPFAGCLGFAGALMLLCNWVVAVQPARRRSSAISGVCAVSSLARWSRVQSASGARLWTCGRAMVGMLGSWPEVTSACKGPGRTDRGMGQGARDDARSPLRGSRAPCRSALHQAPALTIPVAPLAARKNDGPQRLCRPRLCSRRRSSTRSASRVDLHRGAIPPQQPSATLAGRNQTVSVGPPSAESAVNHQLTKCCMSCAVARAPNGDAPVWRRDGPLDTSRPLVRRPAPVLYLAEATTSHAREWAWRLGVVGSSPASVQGRQFQRRRHGWPVCPSTAATAPV